MKLTIILFFCLLIALFFAWFIWIAPSLARMSNTSGIFPDYLVNPLEPTPSLQFYSSGTVVFSISPSGVVWISKDCFSDVPVTKAACEKAISDAFKEL